MSKNLKLSLFFVGSPTGISSAVLPLREQIFKLFLTSHAQSELHLISLLSLKDRTWQKAEKGSQVGCLGSDNLLSLLCHILASYPNLDPLQ